MTDESQSGSARGVLVAMSIVFAALIILLDELRPFTMTLTLDMLPRILRQRIESKAEGVLITATIINRHVPGENFKPPSDNALNSIILNKMRQDLHMGDTQENKRYDKPKDDLLME